MAMNHAVFESEPADQDDVAEADRENARGADEFDDLVNMAAHLADASTATLCIVESGRLVTMVRVDGLGDYLPKYAGNLDIINCAAIATAEHYAKART